MLKLSKVLIHWQYSNKTFVRYISKQINTKNLIHLKQRTLLQLTGDDVSYFLQGLITNDIRHFEKGAVSIYSLLLNTKGKVLYDVIIYKTQEKGIFYIECDSSIVYNFLKHLNMYKLKKNVHIKTMENSMKVWTVYDTNIICQNDCNTDKKNKIEEKMFPCNIINNKSSKITSNILIYSDPRIFELGLRIITQSNITHNEIMNYLKPNISIEKNISNYKSFQYKLGIGEGIKDLAFGVSFPLEINCDYLHGVSFHKGCYIGQELTARTYYTGVVRKRLMPLILNNFDNKQFEFNEKIINDNGKIVGKMKGQEGTVGLGLMRISEALISRTLYIRNCSLKIIKPQWWPQEFQKHENYSKYFKGYWVTTSSVIFKNISIMKDAGIWKCFYCKLQELYDYKGNKPPFAKHLSFSEDCYIMKDPFNPLNSNEILVLGADCSICKNSVCIKCSLFFLKRFCKLCALKNIQHFPRTFQNKIIYLNEEHNKEIK